MRCHENTTPGVIDQWKTSAHFRVGIDCYACHKANDDDPATFDHYGNKIAVIVTPNYCNRCHKKEVTEFEASHHANAASFIGSLDNILGEVVEGGAAAVNGCMQCHGSTVKYKGDGKFDFAVIADNECNSRRAVFICVGLNWEILTALPSPEPHLPQDLGTD